MTTTTKTLYAYITATDKKKLFHCAKLRNTTKDASTTRRTTRIFTDYQLHCLGILGEASGAQILGVSIDWTISYGHGDPGVDLVLPNGWTVAVKFNHRRDAHLRIEQRDCDSSDDFVDFRTDVAVLTYSDCLPDDNPDKHYCSCADLLDPNIGCMIRVAGWISRREFMQVHFERDYRNKGGGVRYCVDQDQLRPMQELIALGHLCVSSEIFGGKPKSRPGRQLHRPKCHEHEGQTLA